jgi:hypothetical protein
MALCTHKRVAAACAGLTVGLFAALVAQRAAAAQATRRQADRELFLESRRERMQAARASLVSTRNGSTR